MSQLFRSVQAQNAAVAIGTPLFVIWVIGWGLGFLSYKKEEIIPKPLFSWGMGLAVKGFIRLGSVIAECVQLAAFSFAPQVPWSSQGGDQVRPVARVAVLDFTLAFHAEFWLAVFLCVLALLYTIQGLRSIRQFRAQVEAGVDLPSSCGFSAEEMWDLKLFFWLDVLSLPIFRTLLAAFSCTYPLQGAPFLDEDPSIECWGPLLHWIYAAVATVLIIPYYCSVLVFTLYYNQMLGLETDVKFKPRFLIILKQFKLLVVTLAVFFKARRYVGLSLISLLAYDLILLLLSQHMKPCNVQEVNTVRTYGLMFSSWVVFSGLLALLLNDTESIVSFVFLVAGLIVIAVAVFSRVRYQRSMKKRQQREERALAELQGREYHIEDFYTGIERWRKRRERLKKEQKEKGTQDEEDEDQEGEKAVELEQVPTPITVTQHDDDTLAEPLPIIEFTDAFCESHKQLLGTAVLPLQGLAYGIELVDNTPIRMGDERIGVLHLELLPGFDFVDNPATLVSKRLAFKVKVSYAWGLHDLHRIGVYVSWVLPGVDFEEKRTAINRIKTSNPIFDSTTDYVIEAATLEQVEFLKVGAIAFKVYVLRADQVRSQRSVMGDQDGELGQSAPVPSADIPEKPPLVRRSSSMHDLLPMAMATMLAPSVSSVRPWAIGHAGGRVERGEEIPRADSAPPESFPPPVVIDLHVKPGAGGLEGAEKRYRHRRVRSIGGMDSSVTTDAPATVSDAPELGDMIAALKRKDSQVARGKWRWRG